MPSGNSSITDDKTPCARRGCGHSPAWHTGIATGALGGCSFSCQCAQYLPGSARDARGGGPVSGAHGCIRKCPDGECHCGEPAQEDFMSCRLCRSADGDCYCGED